jgi:hypothetical protein
MSNEEISGKDSEYLRADQQPVKIIRGIREEAPPVSMDAPKMSGQHVGDDRGASNSGQRTRTRDPRSDALRPAGTTRRGDDQDCKD